MKSQRNQLTTYTVIGAVWYVRYCVDVFIGHEISACHLVDENDCELYIFTE